MVESREKVEEVSSLADGESAETSVVETRQNLSHGSSKTVETGQVRQSFSHGRSKTVQVEVRKKRVFRREGDKLVKSAPAPGAVTDPADALVFDLEDEPQGRRSRQLTQDEKAARMRALQGAQREADDAHKKAEAEGQALAAEEAEHVAFRAFTYLSARNERTHTPRVPGIGAGPSVDRQLRQRQTEADKRNMEKLTASGSEFQNPIEVSPEDFYSAMSAIVRDMDQQVSELRERIASTIAEWESNAKKASK